MANLTGEYDVVTELALGLVNCVVAAIHENEDEAYPRLPHSLRLYVDDAYRGATDPVAQAQRTGVRTRAEIQASTPTVSLPLDGLPPVVMSRSRGAVTTAVRPDPGVVEPAESIGPIGPGRRPTCWPRITVSVRLRAWLLDAPEELPEFLDGELRITAGLARTDLRGAGTFLGLDLVSGLEVGFEPAAGTTLSDAQRGVAEQILRNFLRGDAEPATFKVNLPAEVHRFDYKLEPTGPQPSGMLMVTLSDRPPGPHGPASVTARFLPTGADFAVAVGRDYLVGAFKALLSQVISQAPPQFTASGTGYSATVTPDWSTAGFDLQPGRIVLSLSGSGSITYGGWFVTVTDHFTFTIRVAFVLQVLGGRLASARDGDPEVDLYDVAVFEGTIRDHARDAIRQQVDNALNNPPSELQQILDVGRQLEGLLARLHASPPGVAVTGANIRPDGVVVPGTVALAPSRPVEVRRVGRGGRMDALDSWIPGGTIERFVWDVGVEEHRFVTAARPATSAVAPALGCLSVQGTRVTRGGGVAPVSADDCPLVTAVFPVVPGLPTPPLPCRRPLLALMAASAEGRMEVVGHYDPWASGLAPTGGPTNLLVHFAEEPWAQTATALEHVLAASRKRGAGCVAVVVVPTEGMAQAASVPLATDATVQLTDDPTGGWAAAFGVANAPATVLVGPRGDVRGREEGPLDPSKADRLLDEHLEPGGEVSWRTLRATVAVSDHAPDAPLPLGEGRELAVRRLRGGPAVLSFWTSCSRPSIEQLRQLREALDSGRGDRPAVLGIGDGESAQEVAELAERERLPFPLVPDPERVIARRYGISSWPTTVQIGPDGRVAAADLGLVPGLSPCDRPTAVGAHSTG